MNQVTARPGRLRWRFGDACFDAASLQLSIAGQPVELERRPLQLLALLLDHSGEIVTKDEILAALWPGREVSEASLTTCMTRLRGALGEAGRGAIRTVHGYGYRFAAPVTVEAAAAAPPPEASLTVLAAGDPVPQRPNWRLVQRLGTGGYGDAWLAEQAQSHERRVIKFARDTDGLAALRREVALFRLLREGLGPRPDLIRILDWNFAEPPAFIETAWAEQGNLAEWADRQGGAAALPLDLRLELAAQIAEALAAIHGLAVLHKDLKPANVLMRVDEAGRPAIILTDFGSGRAMDLSRLDALGITRPEPDPHEVDSSGGTQMYRAPEMFAGSAGGAPTAQADIFALGVILFQLAAGDLRRPLAGAWEALIADPLLREDIAAAAAADPAARLADAAELAARLRALQQRRAARARAAAEAEEAARIRRALDLARARRAPVLALVGVLLVGFATSMALYLRADRAQARAEAQAARATAVTNFLTDDIFSAANPALGADPNVPVKTVLAAAAADLDRRFPADDLDRAAIKAAIGSAYAGLALADQAMPLLRASLATRRAQLGDADPQTLAVRLAIIDLAERTGDMPALHENGAAILAAGPTDAATRLRARYAIMWADCDKLGVGGACIAQTRQFLAEVQQLLGRLDPLTLKVQGNLAYLLSQQQHFAEAIPLARDAVERTRAAYGDGHLLVQERRYALAEVLWEADEGAEAATILEDVRRRLLAMSGTETELSARAANQLGAAYGEQKRYDEGLALLRTALDFNVRTRGELFEQSRAGMNNIANMLAFMGRAREAIPMGEKALALYRQARGPDNADTIWVENNLADYYHRIGDLPHTEALYRDVLARAQRVFKPGEWDTAHFEFHLGEVLAQEGKTQEARADLSESAGKLRTILGPDSPRTKRALATLASLPSQ